MSNYSPVVLFAYNRLDELKLTTAALQKNILASQSELFIYSDSAKNEENNKQVQQVRDYIHSIKGFKQVHVVERQYNFGLAQSVIEGVSEIIKKYGSVIVLEDDLITSKNFLCYMNQTLDHYGPVKKVFSVSGFSMPLKSLFNYEKDSYVAIRPSSWGWATWVDRWENIDWDISDYNEFIDDKVSVAAFNKGGIDLSRMLKHYMHNKNNSWAIRWAYAMFKKNNFCIYPKVSKVQNIGFGNDATHCTGVNIYKSILDESTSCTFDLVSEMVPNEKIINEFKYQYSYKNKFIKKSLAYIKSLKK